MSNRERAWLHLKDELRHGWDVWLPAACYALFVIGLIVAGGIVAKQHGGSTASQAVEPLD